MPKLLSVRLEGRGGTPALRAALESKGCAVNGEAPVLSVVTATPPTPPAAPGLAWIWAPSSAVGLRELQHALEQGARDVATGTTDQVASRIAERAKECAEPPEPLSPPPGFVAKSAAARALLEHLRTAARTSMPVLLTGETGTGKELAARLIHDWSARASRTFVPINCAAIPNELMEGELFGYVKGAFSGAVRDYDGQFGAAEGGTVFLDEVDDTPFSLQMKLLRVLEDHVISRLGENAWRRVNFRVLAATNRNLEALIAEGHFGADVYQRLATVRIELPPLRERTEDIPDLVSELLARFDREEPRPKSARVKDVSPHALQLLAAYPWPGNVRELRNVVFGALVAKRTGTELLPSDLPSRLFRKSDVAAAPRYVNDAAVKAAISAGQMNLKRAKEELEKVAIGEALRQSGGNAAQAAKLLGDVGRGTAKDPGSTLRVMMRRLGL